MMDFVQEACLANDGEFSEVTLCFKDSGREQAFLEVRHGKLKSRVFCGLGMTLTSLLVVIALYLIPNQRTFGGPDGASLERIRVSLVGVVALVVIAWMTACCTRCVKLIGVRGFECGTAVLAVLVMMFVPVTFPIYYAKLMGHDPQAVLTMPTSEHELLLYLDIWVTGCHFMLPLRWKTLLLLEIMCPPCYILPAVLLGNHVGTGRVVTNAVIITCLTVVAGVGKRDLEALERTSFVQVAQERVLRAKAENKLHLKEGRAKKKGAESDSASLAETTPTGQIFGQLGQPDGMSVKERLEQMLEVGNREHWIIRLADLHVHFGSILGSGAFGLVVSASYYGAKVVAKIPTPGVDSNQKALAVMAQELRIFRRLHHPNIVLFYGACIDPESSSLILVLEYVRGVELDKAVRGPSLDPDTLFIRCQLVNDICCALSYLHAQQPAIVHGDVKDRNVLVERQETHFKAKLLDFGLSQLLTPRARKLGGTLRWMAPEIITGHEGSLALSTDIFSLGRLVYMITMGEQPLRELSRSDILAEVQRGICPRLTWPSHALLLKQTKEVVEACTSFLPCERPSIRQVQALLRGWGAESSEFSGAATKAFSPGESNGVFAEIYKALCDSSRSGDRGSAQAKSAKCKLRDDSFSNVKNGLLLSSISENSRDAMAEKGSGDAAADGDDYTKAISTADFHGKAAL